MNAPAAAAPPPPRVEFARATVQISTRQGRFAFHVEVARSPAQIERGLMYRTSVAPRSGMLFLFAPAAREWFWMKNTLVPLSIAFFDDSGRIVRMFEMRPCRADPCTTYDPGRAVRGAIELHAGALGRIGARLHDRIAFPR